MKPAPTGLFVLSALFIEASAITTCTSVEVAGAEGDISGTYTFDGSADFIMRAGSTSYILGKYTDDQWRLGEGFYLYYALDAYPHYYVYDANSHPVDVVEAWQLVASADNEEEAPSSFSITCAEDATPSPTLNPTPSPTSSSTPPPITSSTPSPTLGTGSDTSAPITPITSPPGVSSSTSAPVGTTSPVSEEDISCSIDTPCPDDKCCNPGTNQCGRTIDYCQERSGKKMCCSFVSEDLSTTNSCFEDEVCGDGDGRPWFDTWWWAVVGILPISGACSFIYKKVRPNSSKPPKNKPDVSWAAGITALPAMTREA